MTVRAELEGRGGMEKTILCKPSHVVEVQFRALRKGRATGKSGNIRFCRLAVDSAGNEGTFPVWSLTSEWGMVRVIEGGQS